MSEGTITDQKWRGLTSNQTAPVRIATDRTTITGTGTVDDPLVAVGGGGSGVGVDQDGEPIVAHATSLNFTAGATIADGGSGLASITILPDIADETGALVTIGTPIWAGGAVVNADPTGGTPGLVVQSTSDSASLLVVAGVGQGVIAFAADEAYGEAAYTLAEGYLDGNVALGPGFNNVNGDTGTINNFGAGITAFDRTAPIVFDSANPLEITGFVATAFSSSNPIPNVPVIRNVYNAGAGTLTLAHDNAGSAVGNRILCPGAANLVLAQYENAVLQYVPPGSGTASIDGFWIVLSHS